MKYNERQIDYVASLRTDEHQTWVGLFTSQFTSTSVLLVALFQNDFILTSISTITIAMVGLISSIVFVFLQFRALATMKGFEKMIKRIEQENDWQPSTQFVEKTKLEQAINQSLSLGRTVIMLFSGFQVLGWLSLIIFIINEC